jgi:hypothetical protein
MQLETNLEAQKPSRRNGVTPRVPLVVIIFLTDLILQLYELPVPCQSEDLLALWIVSTAVHLKIVCLDQLKTD